jgi:hypothetical protein
MNPAPSAGRTEQLLRDVRKMPLFHQLIPQEAGVGWPLPLRRDNRVYAALPFFGMGRGAEKGKTPLYPIFAALTVDWSNFKPVKYVDFHFENPFGPVPWDQPVGTFPHAAVAGLTVGEYEAKRRELLALYDELFTMLGRGGTFGADWNQRFGGLLRLLLEPGLEPFYRTLAPNFTAQFLGDRVTPAQENKP